MFTQIYGLTTVSDAVVVERRGADHVGVVVDEGVETWDSVDQETAVAIANAIEHARVVALSLSTAQERIAATVAVLRPAIIHLARASRMSSATLAQLREEHFPRELMLTVPVVREEADRRGRTPRPTGDYLLLDSAHPTTGVVGATGLVQDWALSARIVAAVDCRVVLAGGLGPDNVRARTGGAPLDGRCSPRWPLRPPRGRQEPLPTQRPTGRGPSLPTLHRRVHELLLAAERSRPVPAMWTELGSCTRTSSSMASRSSLPSRNRIGRSVSTRGLWRPRPG